MLGTLTIGPLPIGELPGMWSHNSLSSLLAAYVGTPWKPEATPEFVYGLDYSKAYSNRYTRLLASNSLLEYILLSLLYPGSSLRPRIPLSSPRRPSPWQQQQGRTVVHTGRQFRGSLTAACCLRLQSLCELASSELESGDCLSYPVGFCSRLSIRFTNSLSGSTFRRLRLTNCQSALSHGEPT